LFIDLPNIPIIAHLKEGKHIKDKNAIGNIYFLIDLSIRKKFKTNGSEKNHNHTPQQLYTRKNLKTDMAQTFYNAGPH
jgi:hypothetical protein